MNGLTSRGRHGTDATPTAATDGPSRRRWTDRAVSPVIGAILMFALVLAVLAVLQTTAIPALNEDLEFQHNERVRTDVGTLDETVERVAATGNGETTSIESGLRYPPRMFFINPPPVSGTVRTTESGTVEIGNASASGETGDYWDGTPRTFETRLLEYVPDYNEYGSAPVTVAEPWVVADRFEETTRATTEQDLVDGRRLDLVAFEGERSASSAGDVSIAVEPTSAPARPVTVRDDGEPVTLTIPTQLPEDEWEDLLEDELDPAGETGNDRYVTGIDCQQAAPEPCGELTLTLEEGATYELRLGAVAIGSGVDEEAEAYLTDIDGNATAIPETGRQRLVVEARDRFDNPVSGVSVSGGVDGDGSVRAVDPVTDSEGRATFVYEAPADIDGSSDVEATLRFDERTEAEVAFDIRVMDRDGGSSDGGGGTGDSGNSGGDGTGDDGSGTAPSATITAVSENTNGNQDRYDVSLEATDADGNLESAEFELRNPETGDSIDSATADLGGDSETVSRTLRARGGDQLAAYRIVVTAIDTDGNAGSAETTVSGSGS